MTNRDERISREVWDESMEKEVLRRDRGGLTNRGRRHGGEGVIT